MRSFLLAAAVAASALTGTLTFANAATSDPLTNFLKPVTDAILPQGMFSSRDPRLAQIDSQVTAAEQRAMIAHRRGQLSARNVMFVREDGKAIRNAASYEAGKNGGNLPDSTYNALLGRVVALNQTIDERVGRG